MRTDSKRNRRHARTRLLAACLLACAAFLLAPLRGLTQSGSGDQKGETGQVLLLPHKTVDAGEIKFKADSDHDGMSDADEAKNGTDPNDPSDADGDEDGDGLSNADEVAGGSDVNSADSDGDGVSDGEERRLGYDPNDPASTAPTGANLVSIEATPRTLSLGINSLFGPRPAQIVVTGRLTNGTTVNLTYDPGTTYQSLNPSVALVDTAGLAVGTAPGSTSIVVRRGSLTAQVAATVTPFAAGPLSSLLIPGYANNVEVVGDYAYVAAGSAGLQVVDVRDRRAPRLVGGLDTDGNADDVRVVGELAYVADGPGGLKIMSIADRAAPVLVGSVAVPGDAMDVFIQGPRAYLACGSEGLRVVDVSNPAAPALRGGVTAFTNRMARGVSAAGATVIVVDDNQITPRLYVIDAADAMNPRVLGERGLSALAGGGVKDVETRGSLAYVAGFTGMSVVSFSNRAAPVVVGSLTVNQTAGFSSLDLVLNGDYAAFADVGFINAIPFVDISAPATPRYSGAIDFTAMGDYSGTGIAIDQQYAYMTGVAGPIPSEHGATGATRLFIGQYDSLTDNAGIAPSVVLDSPREGQSAVEGTSLTFTATATDDLRVAGVQFFVNGAEVGPQLTSPPYRLDYTVPLGVASLAVSAVATDYGGNTATATANVTVTPDPPPAVRLTAPAEGATLVNGETLALKADASDNVSVSRVVFGAGGAEVGSDADAPYEAAYRVPEGATSVTITATATDNFGRTATASRTFAVVADPLTTVTGSVTGGGGADVTVLGRGAQASAGGLFNVGGVPTTRGPVKARALVNAGGQVYSGASQRVAPVRGGVTDVGAFGLAPVGRILYERTYQTGEGLAVDIFSANVDGTDRVNLTPYPGWQLNPVVSPDGRKFLYDDGRGNCNSSLVMANIDGTGAKIVEAQTGDYAWSPDGSQIAYEKFEWYWNGSAWEDRHNLYVVDRHLTTRRQLTFDKGVRKGELKWSPDGTRILYVGSTEGGPSNGFSYDLYAVNVSTLAISRLTFSSLLKYEPLWSPGGSRVAFLQEDDDASDNVYTVTPAGTGLNRLTPGGFWYYDLAWAADGSSIAAAREASTASGSSIVLLDPTTGAENVLVPETIYNWQPRWSEDGTQLAFLSDEGIQAVEVDGTGQRRLNDITDTYNFHWLKAGPPAPDPLTTVQGRVVDGAGVPVAGARVRVGEQFTATSSADGTFAVPNVPAFEGKVTAFASAKTTTRVLSGGSTPTVPVAGGVTQVGDVRAAEKLVLVSWRDGGNSELYSADADGTRERRLTNNAYEEYRPSLSPDGTRLAFASTRSGGSQIHVMNIDGSGAQQLTFECNGAFDPRWSPDGTKIAFTARPGNNADVHVINADGRNLVRLTNNAADDYYPDWSPDSKRLVFVSLRDGNNEIYAMSADGTGQTRLTNRPTTSEEEPAWSPDGTKIAFNSYGGGVTDAIYLMNSNGSSIVRLTPTDVGSYYPAWSHDGSKIAFSTARSGGWQIWSVKPTGGTLTRVTNNTYGSDFQPEW